MQPNDGKDLDLEFCVYCPLRGKHVPYTACINLKNVGTFGNQISGFYEYYSEDDGKNHPIEEIVTLPSMNGSKEVIDAYKFTPKCKFFNGLECGSFSRIIRSINCSFEDLPLYLKTLYRILYLFKK